jgi:hypothetical protein
VNLPIEYHRAKAFDEYLKECLGIEDLVLQHALWEMEQAYKVGDELRIAFANNQLCQVMKASEEAFHEISKEQNL